MHIICFLVHKNSLGNRYLVTSTGTSTSTLFAIAKFLVYIRLLRCAYVTSDARTVITACDVVSAALQQLLFLLRKKYVRYRYRYR